jgi:hypothetical protein
VSPPRAIPISNKERKERAGYHARREVMFLSQAYREGDPQERKRLLRLANYERGQAKLYRMLERRGFKRAVRFHATTTPPTPRARRSPSLTR